MARSPSSLPPKVASALASMHRTEAWEEGARARAILLVGKGWTSRQVADALGMTPGSVDNLRSKFRRSGIDGVRSRPHTGRNPVLAPAVGPMLELILAERPAPVWTVPRLAREIASRGGPAVSDSWLRRVLKKTGTCSGDQGTR